MKRTKAQIKIMPVGKLVDGYIFKDAPGLSVHRLSSDPTSWRVTHTPTGLRLNELYPNTLKEGIVMVEELARNLDWDSKEKIFGDEQYSQRLVEVVSKHLPSSTSPLLEGLDFNLEGLGLMCDGCSRLDVVARWKLDNFCSDCIESGYALSKGFPQKAVEIYYILRKGVSK